MEDIVVKLKLDNQIPKQMKESKDAVLTETSAMQSPLNNLKSIFSGIGVAVAGAFTISKIVDFGRACVSAYDQSAQAAVKLKTALGYTSQALLDQAAALQKKSRFDDDAIIAAQGALAIYGLTEAQIKKVTPAILDMAAATGTDLTTAAEKVGKSIGTSTNALAREGIAIDDSTSKSERLDQALTGLTRKFEGQARAMSEVGTGPAVVLKNAFGDVMEEIGKVISESDTFKASMMVIADAIGIVGKMIKWFRSGKEDNPFSLMTDAELEKEKTKFNNLADMMSDVIATSRVGSKAFDEAFVSLGKYGSEADKIAKEQEDRAKRRTVKEEDTIISTKPKKEKATKETDLSSMYNRDLEDLKAYFKDQQKIEEDKKKLREKEVEEYAKTRSEMDDIDQARKERLAKLDADIAKERRKAGKDALRESTANLSAIAGQVKEFGVVYQAAAIAQTTMDTYQSATGIFKNIASAPFLGVAALPLAFAGAAIAVGAGLANVATIAAQKFEGGGIVGGNSFSGDNVMIRANSAEMVLNQVQQKQLFNQLNGGGGSSKPGLQININVAPGGYADKNGIVDALNSAARAGAFSNAYHFKAALRG